MVNSSLSSDQLRTYLDAPHAAQHWLRGLGVVDLTRGHADLARMAAAGVTLDLLADICGQLALHLPAVSDPDMALSNLERFVSAARSPLAIGALFERDRDALPVLLQIFSTSQYLSDLLVNDSESYDLLRLTEGEPVSREVLVTEVCAEIDALLDESAVSSALRRFKRRETLRIAYGDIVRGHRLETVTKQISYLADAILEAAVRAARRDLQLKRGTPRNANGEEARFVAIGLGKLGGEELNYSSDIDLVFLYDSDGATDGERPLGNREFFERLARGVIRLLSESTPLGAAYRVDLRLRPEGQQGPAISNIEAAWQYYDTVGRTWERQAFVKARPAAGNLELGREFLAHLEPWIYRHYLNRADIAGIRALKRRIEHRTAREGADSRNVKTGHGGIRDIEFVIQFLQLLNGGDLPQVRTGNTLDAIARLEAGGCLTQQERSILEENYAFLRKIEHRLQIMFDLQTHLLPAAANELTKIAIRMGYHGEGRESALAAFEVDYKQRTELNRKILDHLLHDAFGDDEQTEPEVDLVLDPDPPEEEILAVLSRYAFRNVSGAYTNLMELTTEKIRFLSTRRCRHFLAAIAKRLLEAIARTPDPDSTLINLTNVSNSLGGKGVLWELFSFNPPVLQLYVDVCSCSPYLSSILIGNPGMIDELMDSLVLDRLPTLDGLKRDLAELTHNAESLDLILHSFKNAQQLRVGVRDILGKDDVQAITGALSDIAQVSLTEIARQEYQKLVAKMGEPMSAAAESLGQPAELILLALGKFGGRELNYYSDVDLIFVYDSEGSTFHTRRSRRSGETSTNQHFFSELGQRIIKSANQLGPFGRLYQIDARLRPTGRSGALATSLDEFARYFASDQAQLWERQALCKARVVYGSEAAAQRMMAAVAEAAYPPPSEVDLATSIRTMRLRLEDGAGAGNLKRGPGGVVDIEFLVQLLQLRHGRENPSVREPNTLAAIAALYHGGYLDLEDFEFLSTSYRVLRVIQIRLRLLYTTARDNLPDDPIELQKLARLLSYPDREVLMADCRMLTRNNRAHFERLVGGTALVE